LGDGFVPVIQNGEIDAGIRGAGEMDIPVAGEGGREAEMPLVEGRGPGDVGRADHRIILGQLHDGPPVWHYRGNSTRCWTAGSEHSYINIQAVCTQQKRQTKAEKHAATRAALLGFARTLFASTGYAETGTEDVVKQAGVTRGALYYHFADKRALFEAVVEQEAASILAAIEEAAGKAKSPLDAL